MFIKPTEYAKALKIVTFAGGTDNEILAMIKAADQGLINLSDYWSVGDERQISLEAMAATGVGESHAAQTVTIKLVNAGGKTLKTTTPGGRTTCSFVWQLKDCLNETGYMEESNTNANGWNGCKRRTWCNEVFYNALPAWLKEATKEVLNKTSAGNKSTTLVDTYDKIALPCMTEVGLTYQYAVAGEGTAWSYYTSDALRIKKVSGSANVWWSRSPSTSTATTFCIVTSSGAASSNSASSTSGLAPFGCF